MKSSILDSISSPEDLKNLSFEELGPLCTEIRQTLIQTTAKSGGHLASNLGTVELTVALHRVFDCPAGLDCLGCRASVLYAQIADRKKRSVFHPAAGRRTFRFSKTQGKCL